MTWQERLSFVLFVVLAAYCVHALRLPHLWSRWRARHPNWRKAPPSEFGQFTRDEWLAYRRKNRGTW